MATFSIIIPHKNIPVLLQRCLASIPERDDIQVIIVDDNSDEDIVDFQNFPGLNRHNTEVYFDKTGRGAGRARNVGLEHAKGEWVLFADADDVFCNETNVCLNYLKETNADLVYFRVESRDSETLESNNETDYQNEICKKFAQGDISALKYHHEVPWGKAARRYLITSNNIKFDELQCGNDSLFAMKCDYHSFHTEYYPHLLYCWMTRHDSLWHTHNDNWYRIRFISRIHIVQFFKNKNIDYEWCDQRLYWYLQSIQYTGILDYLHYHWLYAITCCHYSILFTSVIDQLRVKLALGRFL